MSVCIIGSGAAGLCSARQCLNHSLNPTIFEQEDCIGGTWILSKQVGVQKNGLDVHSSMYEGLRTNLPKEIMGFPDFPICDNVGNSISYISAEEISKYLNEYSEKFLLKQYVKFSHYVVQVKPHDGKWEVYTIDMISKTERHWLFDFIMICNGHYNIPKFPVLKGSEKFDGNQIHSHDYRSPENYKNHSVLVIGAGPSGMDICNEVSKYATKVVLSHHLPDLPKRSFRHNVFLKTDVREISAKKVYFMDDTIDTFSTIIYCTGYKYAFPFLSVDCGIYVEDNFVQPLYKHCVNIKYPSMALIGIPFYVCAFQMMDLQARFVIKHIWQNKFPPSENEMSNDTVTIMNQRWKYGFNKNHAHMMGPYQGSYYLELSTSSNIECINEVNTSLHNESSKRFIDDLRHFRNDVFKIIDDRNFVYIKKG